MTVTRSAFPSASSHADDMTAPNKTVERLYEGTASGDAASYSNVLPSLVTGASEVEMTAVLRYVSPLCEQADAEVVPFTATSTGLCKAEQYGLYVPLGPDKHRNTLRKRKKSLSGICVRTAWLVQN